MNGRTRDLDHLTRARSWTQDRMAVALAGVFILVASLYLWRATAAAPLALHGSANTPYNQLADAFLHLHLWVARFSAAALGPEPNNPAKRPAFLSAYPDYPLYHGKVYLEWGPAILVLLIPLHLLGYEPSASVIIAPFAIVGLGFALAALRVLLKQIGDVKLWMCILAALTLACSSVVPYILRFPLAYHEAVAGGYCFTMIGIWLAVSAIVARRASLTRLSLMSLCFGLAAGARPTLGLAALILVVVYKSLEAPAGRRRSLVALAVPAGVCFLLLAAYNQARYGNPLEVGVNYSIDSGSYGAHWNRLSYVPPGLWSYLITPPQLSVLFPFMSIIYPQLSYPLHLPEYYASYSEQTGGLLPMAPIAIFLAGLPWMWRRRPGWLGALAPALLLMASVGASILFFLCYQFFGSTERYEVDYTTLLIFGALAVWLALSVHLRGRCRRMVRVGGGLLAAWSCVAGVAICYQELQTHTSTWRTLVNVGSPLSTAIASAVGHPILAEVETPNIVLANHESYGSVGTNVTAFWLGVRDQADLTIVSPDSRTIALTANVFAGSALPAGVSPEAHIRGPGRSSHSYRLPTEGNEVQIPVSLTRGVNRLVLAASDRALGESDASLSAAKPEPPSNALISLSNVHILDNLPG
jgi:hypothetical protein